MTRPSTIDEVLGVFDEIIDWARAEHTPIGYFPAVYRGVTRTIEERIAAGAFQDAERMTRFDVGFANRYIDAFRSWRAGGALTDAWRVSFEAASRADLTILQHLLLGVNAHMNLDLGCAASAVAPGAALPSLEPDFLLINTILDGLVDHDRLAVDSVSPRLREVDRVGALSDRFVDLDIAERRRRSWAVAERLAPLDGPARDATIAEVDAHVVAQSHHVVHPELALREILLHVVRPHEPDDPADVITALLK